jgi:natural product precursor
MKKQIKKLSLNKKTISNLNATEMNRQVGGVSMTCTYPRVCGHTNYYTCNGKTCNQQCTW